jgi:hypothetical protein
MQVRDLLSRILGTFPVTWNALLEIYLKKLEITKN